MGGGVFAFVLVDDRKVKLLGCLFIYFLERFAIYFPMDGRRFEIA